jgi:isopenicillin-N N-acyltransferase like protein
MMKYLAACLSFFLSVVVSGAEILGREGPAYLEKVDGLMILHVQGTPYQMGYQHGKLLRSHVRELVDLMLNQRGGQEIELPGVTAPQSVKDVVWRMFQSQRPFYRPRFLEELRGLADGSGISEKEVCTANHIPELFHCSGFALMGAATVDGEVYHGRVLDYGTEDHLQDHALIIIAQPEKHFAFANVSFAGFIGSVTGMNEKHIAIGEMGGGGQLFWAGEPMSFLVRRVLEEADSLAAGVDIFKYSPRTCEYYYVISDGARRQAAGLATTWQDIFTIGPGEFHPLLPEPVKDCVLLSADNRYRELVRRVKENYGKFDAEKGMRLMDAPVAMGSNLHDALMRPKSGDFWVAYAAKNGSSAWNQKYVHLNLVELLKKDRGVIAEAK